MTERATNPGRYMAAEAAQALPVFCAAAVQDVPLDDGVPGQAIYTIARGSSDAAANVLSYEFMRVLGVPVTSLPPSIFSLGQGVKVARATALVVSQSGASDDLVRAASGAAAQGAKVLAITNQRGSAVEAAAHLTIPINAGPERAVPATKTVVGAIGAGLAILRALSPDYATQMQDSIATIAAVQTAHPKAQYVQAALLRARHVYVIGRDTSYGAAHEVALKLKECCAIHAEAYSASEVLHGPLQLATNPLTILMLDTGTQATQGSLDAAEARFRAEGCDVLRLRPVDVGVTGLTPAAAAALLLALVYPIILRTALALGFDPDAPATLSKVTRTT